MTATYIFVSFHLVRSKWKHPGLMRIGTLEPTGRHARERGANSLSNSTPYTPYVCILLATPSAVSPPLRPSQRSGIFSRASGSHKFRTKKLRIRKRKLLLPQNMSSSGIAKLAVSRVFVFQDIIIVANIAQAAKKDERIIHVVRLSLPCLLLVFFPQRQIHRLLYLFHQLPHTVAM